MLGKKDPDVLHSPSHRKTNGHKNVHGVKVGPSKRSGN